MFEFRRDRQSAGKLQFDKEIYEIYLSFRIGIQNHYSQGKCEFEIRDHSIHTTITELCYRNLNVRVLLLRTTWCFFFPCNRSLFCLFIEQALGSWLPLNLFNLVQNLNSVVLTIEK